MRRSAQVVIIPMTRRSRRLDSGGYLSNASGGSVTGAYAAVQAMTNPATVLNAGSIGGGTTGSGVALAAGGAVTNQSGATISGCTGVAATGATLENAGGISGTKDPRINNCSKFSIAGQAVMPGEGPASTPFHRPALQDVDTGPSPGMTWRGKRVTPDDSVNSQRLLRSEPRSPTLSATLTAPNRQRPPGRAREP